MFRMTNPIQEYAWGSRTAFSDLFGWAPSASPQAEIWMGAHRRAPSQVNGTPLNEHLQKNPDHLGAWADTGALPYLLKVLAAEVPLSIQAHPTRAQAAAGRAAEDAAGLPADSPERTYADANHKPEMTVAVTRFAALCGLRDVHQTIEALSAIGGLLQQPESEFPHGGDAERHASVQEQLGALEEVIGHLRAGQIKSAVRTILQDRAAECATAAGALTQTASARLHQALGPETTDTVERIRAVFPSDPGLFVALMLNRVDLEPGEAIYLPAGNLHAYLSGTGVEIMAASDNVVRGGLTTKRVDVAALLSVLDPEAVPPPLVTPRRMDDYRLLYRTPAEEFELERIDCPDSEISVELPGEGPSIACVLQGSVQLTPLNGVGSASGSTAPTDSNRCLLSAGESVFIPAGERLMLSGSQAQVFVARPRRAALEEAGQ